MANSMKVIVAIGLIGLAAACARQQEEVVVIDPVPAPIEPEPTFDKF